MRDAFQLPKSAKCGSHFCDHKFWCTWYSTTSLPLNLDDWYMRFAYDLYMIWIWRVVYEFHLDFTLYLWGCLPENTCKKTKQWSILYQSSSETDLVKLYRNTTFTYYDPVYSNLHPFYKVLPYQNYWNVKYNTKEMISISNLTFFKISFAT